MMPLQEGRREIREKQHQRSSMVEEKTSRRKTPSLGLGRRMVDKTEARESIQSTMQEKERLELRSASQVTHTSEPVGGPME